MNKLRKITLGIVLILCILTLSSCTSREDNINSDTPPKNRFISIEDKYEIGGYTYKVYYDSKTTIVYLVNSTTHQGAITVIYDEDGKPMTLDVYNETKLK